MNICMSIYRSIELRKNTSGSYKVRLTIDRGSKFCGARKSLGLGTHQEDCALRRAYLMRCLLFHMGWFPGGKIAVRNSAECGIKEVCGTAWTASEIPECSGSPEGAAASPRMKRWSSGFKRMEMRQCSVFVCLFPDGE